MNAPTSWHRRVEEYLTYRRQLGFTLTNQAFVLRQFAKFADQSASQNRLTVSLAIAWGEGRQHQKPITLTRRIETLRGFAKYLLQFDPATEVPPQDLFHTIYRRPVPHIYNDEEIVALMGAAEHLPPRKGLRPQTFRTVFGLLATSGLRISEAVNLDRSDVNLNTGVLSVRKAKFNRSRIVPLHSSATAALRSYARLRDRSLPLNNSQRFFLLEHGKPTNREVILHAWQSCCEKLGLQVRGDYPHHRLQDVRHTFIVRSILRFYQQGISVDRAILALSTYVGHSNIAHTYWYCTAIPELMNIAAKRFHRYSQGDPQ